jgi:hypothetical protein
VIATHGRGFWVLDNFSALRAITPEVTSSAAYLFDIAPVVRRLRGNRNWTRIKSTNVARNPPRGAVIDYFLAQRPVGEAVLTIMDGHGETIRSFSSKAEDGATLHAEAGTNRFVWDLRYPAIDVPLSAGALPKFESSDHSPPTPPVAPPGTYTARLTVDGNHLEKTFEIRKDPNISASIDDLNLQFELMVGIQELIGNVTKVILELRDFRTRILGTHSGSSPESVAKSDAVLQELDTIEGKLTIWMGSTAHPMMFGPPGLIQKLSRLSGAVASDDARPTASMRAVFEDLDSRFRIQRDRLNQLMVQMDQ